MSIDRILLVTAGGTENIGERGRYAGNDSDCKTIKKVLKTHTYVELSFPRSDYDYDPKTIALFVANDYRARANFVQLCKIARKTPEDCVFAVSNCEGLLSLHKTYDGAKAALDLVDDDEVGCFLSLEQIED